MTRYLRHKTVKRLAGEWSDGPGDALWRLHTTGAIRPDVVKAEIHKCIDLGSGQEGQELDDLLSLLDYVDRHGERGPVEGWGQLSW